MGGRARKILESSKPAILEYKMAKQESISNKMEAKDPSCRWVSVLCNLMLVSVCAHNHALNSLSLSISLSHSLIHIHTPPLSTPSPPPHTTHT